MPYNELEHYYSLTTISLATFLTTAKEELKHHFDQDAEHTLNQILGGAIITYLSRLEHGLENNSSSLGPVLKVYLGDRSLTTWLIFATVSPMMGASHW